MITNETTLYQRQNNIYTIHKGGWYVTASKITIYKYSKVNCDFPFFKFYSGLIEVCITFSTRLSYS